MIGVRGSVANHKLTFMIDSGASCNFMSFALFRTLGLSFDNNSKYTVKLADGATLETCGVVAVEIDFDSCKYIGQFHVLPGSVPLILGMSFLGEMRPSIDWTSKSVFVG